MCIYRCLFLLLLLLSNAYCRFNVYMVDAFISTKINEWLYRSHMNVLSDDIGVSADLLKLNIFEYDFKLCVRLFFCWSDESKIFMNHLANIYSTYQTVCLVRVKIKRIVFSLSPSRINESEWFYSLTEKFSDSGQLSFLETRIDHFQWFKNLLWKRIANQVRAHSSNIEVFRTNRRINAIKKKISINRLWLTLVNL